MPTNDNVLARWNGTDWIVISDVKPACRDCRYWAPPFTGVPDGAYGDCRRHPPAVDFVGETPMTAWPATHANEWCGEFLPHVVQPPD